MNKYLKAISANLIIFAVNTVSFLVITPLAINIMGDEFYGLWSVLYAIILFSNIGNMGIGSIVNKFSAEKLRDGETTHSDIIFSGMVIILPMALLTAILLLVIKDFIASNLNLSSFLEDQFKTAVSICALGVFPQFLMRVPQGYLLSQLNNSFVRMMEFLNHIFPLIGAVIIVLFRKDLTWVALWSVFVQYIILFLYFNKIKHTLHGCKLKPSLIRKMTAFSLYMFLETSAIAFFQQFDRILVGMVLGPTMAGVYAVGTSVAVRLSIITGQITDVMVPYASLKNSINDNGTLFKIFRKMSLYISTMIGIVGGALIIWMSDILTIWISHEYALKYSKVFSLIIIAYGFVGLCRPAHQTLTGLGQVKFTSVLYSLSTLIMLIGVFIFSKIYNITGAAASNLMMAFLLIMNLRAYKLLGDLDWTALITDLKWGISLPVMLFLLLLFNQLFITKIALTFLLICFGAITFARDVYLRTKLTDILQKSQLKLSIVNNQKR